MMFLRRYTVDELVKMVSQKTGLPDDKARIAVQIVVDYMKKKLPGPVAGQIDSVLQGGGGLADAAKGLGGMLGRK